MVHRALSEKSSEIVQAEAETLSNGKGDLEEAVQSEPVKKDRMGLIFRDMKETSIDPPRARLDMEAGEELTDRFPETAFRGADAEKRYVLSDHDEVFSLEGNTDVTVISRAVQILIDPLTNRETEILLALSEGLSNKEIADRFILTEGTVKNHLYNLYSKLEVKRRSQAIMRARELRILS
jgi:ATP/maltotriose-dependent transcriptional regulator MalT